MPAPISVQLYTLREQAAADMRGVLERVGDIGFVGVETAGFNGLTPAEFKAALDDSGLVASSAHVGLAKSDDYKRELDAHQQLGCTLMVIPALGPDMFADKDAVQRAAELITKAAGHCRDRGLTLGYHNHFWEFEAQIDGRPALFHLFDLLADDIVAEIDIYWARVGGSDPVEVVKELGNRSRLLHVKDGPADAPASDMVAVGDGVIEVGAVLGANDAVQWHIVELDRCATDMFDAVERSYRYLVGNELSRGRK